MFIRKHKEVVFGVHVLFNETISAYLELYYNALIKKFRFEIVDKESTVESFAYLQGMSFVDDENYLEF